MRNPRKYLVISILSAVLVALLLLNGGREWFRMAAAAERQNYQYAQLGAQLYAQNCMQCHGPRGEGVVGMPLNRPDLQGDPRDSRYGETYRMLIDTISNGRPGTNTTRWEAVTGPDGKQTWLSYSAMPQWARSAGGPMDEYQVQSLAYFIMMGNEKVNPEDPNSLTFWDSIGGMEFPAAPTMPPAEEGGIAATPIDRMPNAAGLTEAENEAAKILIRDTIKPSCLACHTFGSWGAAIGPDLTYTGTWGVDAEFLKGWIRNPSKVPGHRRMPSYWSANRLNTGPEPVLEKPVEGPTYSYMPAFENVLTEEQLDLLVRYLMGLGVKE